MIAVVQRVLEAEVRVEEPPHRAAIGRGLLVLLGVLDGDGAAEADRMATKLARLRIFPDDEGRMNRDVVAVGGDLLVVSQFTLAGDCERGNRPSFVAAAAPEVAEPLYRRCCEALEKATGRPVGRGVFRADMRVSLVNDGPVTLILRS